MGGDTRDGAGDEEFDGEMESDERDSVIEADKVV